MNTARNFSTTIRAVGTERLWLLAILTGGHFVIHWFQQFFPVILPSIKSGLGLSNVEVGALSSALAVKYPEMQAQIYSGAVMKAEASGDVARARRIASDFPDEHWRSYMLAQIDRDQMWK